MRAMSECLKHDPDFTKCECIFCLYAKSKAEVELLKADRDSETRWACQYKNERDKAEAEVDHWKASYHRVKAILTHDGMPMTGGTEEFWELFHEEFER